MLRLRSTRLRALLAAALLALAVALGTVAPATPALAHDQLIEQSPAEGEEFATAPTEAALRFSGDILELGTELALVRDDTGALVQFPSPYVTAAGGRVTQPLPALEDGEYTLNWRVVSEDGHPITGSIHFGVGMPAGDGPDVAVADAGASSPGSPDDLFGTLAGTPLGIGLGVAAIAAGVGGAVLLVARLRRDGGFRAPGALGAERTPDGSGDAAEDADASDDAAGPGADER